MKIINKTSSVFLLLSMLFSTMAFAQISDSPVHAPAEVDNVEMETKEVFEMVEKGPQFPGGQDSMYSFIVKNLVYPSEAVSKNIQGRVILEFIVDENGNISDAKVLRGVHPLLDEAAILMLGKMPRWTPGEQRGKPVKVKFRLPVQFKL